MLPIARSDPIFPTHRDRPFDPAAAAGDAVESTGLFRRDSGGDDAMARVVPSRRRGDVRDDIGSRCHRSMLQVSQIEISTGHG